MAEVIGYNENLDYYCVNCVPNDDIEAIFDDAETDTIHHCMVCGALIPEKLDKDGMDELIGRLEDYLISRKGEKDPIHMWCHQYMHGARTDVEKKIFELAFWATGDEAPIIDKEI